MSLHVCGDCHGQVSSSAASCPHCGKQQISFAGKLVMWVVCVAAAIVIFGVLLVSH